MLLRKVGPGLTRNGLDGRLAPAQPEANDGSGREFKDIDETVQSPRPVTESPGSPGLQSPRFEVHTLPLGRSH